MCLRETCSILYAVVIAFGCFAQQERRAESLRTKGLLVVVLILLLTSCTVVAARNKASTPEAAVTPTAVSRPAPQFPNGGDDAVPPLSTRELDHEVAPPPAILDITGKKGTVGLHRESDSGFNCFIYDVIWE